MQVERDTSATAHSEAAASVAAAQASARENTSRAAHAAQLASQTALAELRCQLDDTQAEAERSHAAEAELLARLTALQSTTGPLQDEVASFLPLRQQLEGQLAEATAAAAAAAAAQLQLQTAHQQMQTAAAERQKRFLMLQRTYKAGEEALKEEVEQLTGEVERLTAEMETHRDQALAACQQAEASKLEDSAASQQVDADRSRVLFLEAQLVSIEQQMGNLRGQVAELEVQLTAQCLATEAATARCSVLEASHLQNLEAAASAAAVHAQESEAAAAAAEVQRNAVLHESAAVSRSAIAARDEAVAALEAAVSHQAAMNHQVIAAEASLSSCQHMLREAEERATAAENAKIELVMSMAAGSENVEDGAAGGNNVKLRSFSRQRPGSPVSAVQLGDGAVSELGGGGGVLLAESLNGWDGDGDDVGGVEGAAAREVEGSGGVTVGLLSRRVSVAEAELGVARTELSEVHEQLRELRSKLKLGGGAYGVGAEGVGASGGVVTTIGGRPPPVAGARSTPLALMDILGCGANFRR